MKQTRVNSRYPFLIASIAMLVLPISVVAQNESERTGDEDSIAAQERGIPRDQVEQVESGSQAGTEEGRVQVRPQPGSQGVRPYWLPPERTDWKLGVYANNTDTGVVITRVLPRSAAQRVGLERGDRIVTVGGFRIGWVQNRLSPLDVELNRQASRRGHVNLLVQNVRTNELLNLDVQLDSRDRRVEYPQFGGRPPAPEQAQR